MNFEELQTILFENKKKLNFAPYSPSKLETGALCLGHFQAEYVKKMKKNSFNKSALDKGSATHYVLEKIIQKRFNDEPFSMTDVSIWLEEAKIMFPHISGDLLAVVEEMSNDMIERSLEIPLYKQANVKEVEKKIAIDYNGNPCAYEIESINKAGKTVMVPDPNCFARGKIDVYMEVGHDAYVIDHKTQKNYEKANTPKMMFYAWLVFRANPDIQCVYLTLNFCDPLLGFFGRTERVLRHEVIPAKEGDLGFSYNPDEQILPYENHIINQIYRIESKSEDAGTWTQTVNSKCHYCADHFTCEERKESSLLMAKGGYTEISSMADAQKVLSSILVMEDMIDHGKDQLKAYIEREDVVDRMVRVSDRAFMKKKEIHNEWKKADKSKLHDFIKKIGEVPENFLEYSPTLLKKLFDSVDDARLEIEIKSIVPQKVVVKNVIGKAPAF
jgi:hypothetical protein